MTALDVLLALVWLLVGLWIGWHARARQRPPLVAPIEVRAYIDKRVADLRERIIGGVGYIDRDRARLGELESLKFEIERGDK